MRMIQHEVLRRHFIPSTAASARSAEIEAPSRDRMCARAVSEIAPARAPVVLSPPRPAGRARTLLRAGGSIALALLGARTFERALARRGVAGALFRGSVAAGAAYVQDRHANGARAALESRPPERSILAVYAVAGLGLGIGSLIANRRRRR